MIVKWFLSPGVCQATCRLCKMQVLGTPVTCQAGIGAGKWHLCPAGLVLLMVVSKCSCAETGLLKLFPQRAGEEVEGWTSVR